MDYHINKDGQTEGPLADTQIARRVLDGSLGPDDLVWCEGWEDWKSLRDSGLMPVEVNTPDPAPLPSEAEPQTPAATTPPGPLFRIKPPYWATGFLLGGLILHYAYPILRVPGWGNPGIAFLLGTGSIMLFIWSVAQFIHRDTPLSPAETAKVLITDGPYQYSRNPIYAAMVGFTAAFAAGYGTLPTLAAPVALYFVLARVFIAAEEKKLLEQFGEDYRAYCAKVRRWV